MIDSTSLFKYLGITQLIAEYREINFHSALGSTVEHLLFDILPALKGGDSYCVAQTS